MAKVLLSQLAVENIDEILNNVYEFTGFPSSAQNLLNEFNKTSDLIAFMPNAIGRLREDGDREAFCRAYRIVYRQTGQDEITVVTIIHSRRLYPRPY